MSTMEEITAQALTLALNDRVKLAEELLRSLEDLRPEEAQELWADAAERRLHEVRSGAAKTVAAEEVLRKAEAILR